MKKIVAIIGAGNMGKAIAKRLVDGKVVEHNQLILTNSKTNTNREAVKKADIVILAVKPQIIKAVLEEIKHDIRENQLIISIAAGVTSDSLTHSIGKDKHIVRAMPNIAALVGESMSGWIANESVTAEEKETVRVILSAMGKEMQLECEQHLDMVTAISGSGPAYFFYITELLEKAAKAFGFSEDMGQLLARQTFIGAAEVLKKDGRSLYQLRGAVTSKGGTTEAAFAKLAKGNFDKLFIEGIMAAYKRAKELKIS